MFSSPPFYFAVEKRAEVLFSFGLVGALTLLPGKATVNQTLCSLCYHPRDYKTQRSAMTYTPNRRSFLIAGELTTLASTKVFGANDRLRIGVIGGACEGCSTQPRVRAFRLRLPR